MKGIWYVLTALCFISGYKQASSVCKVKWHSCMHAFRQGINLPIALYSLVVYKDLFAVVEGLVGDLDMLRW